MANAIQAVETAVFAALSAAITAAPVYQHPPENAPWPLVIVGDIDGATPIGFDDDDDDDRIVPLQIAVVTEGRERAPCIALVGQVVSALRNNILIEAGFTIRALLESETVNNTDDGKGYVGIVQFRVFALGD
ncbi:MAG: DUF3168 domain-containing protein [Sphingomonas sp.]|nr:DUF3168 domain-containing protein [Sphingomonas sp.]